MFDFSFVHQLLEVVLRVGGLGVLPDGGVELSAGESLAECGVDQNRNHSVNPVFDIVA